MDTQVPENPAKNRIGSFTPLVVIAVLLVTVYLTANVMSVKLLNLGRVTWFDNGTLIFPIAYMLGDVLTELWGFKTAKKVILLAFFCNLFFVLLTLLGVVLPAPDYMAATNQAYAQVFSYVPRIVAASLVGFLLGELSNSWAMEKIKALTHGKHLWLRTIGSSLVGYLFDTVLFVLIAFAGTVTTADLLSVMGIQFGVKLLLEALGGTPLAYLIIGRLQRSLPQKEGTP